MCFSVHIHMIFWLLPSSPSFEINTGIMSRPPLWAGRDWIVTDVLAEVAAVTGHHFSPIPAWTMEVPSGCVSLSPPHIPSLWVCDCDKLPEPGSCHCLSLLSSGCSLLQPHPGQTGFSTLFDGFCLIVCVSFGSLSFKNDLNRIIGLSGKRKIKMRGAG